MLRHPFRRYIYYLFSRRGLSTAQIMSTLTDLGVPLPQKNDDAMKFIEAVVRARTQLIFPAGYDPTTDPLNEPTRAFLADLQITSMWKQDEFVKCAYDLLFEPQIRRMIEALLLGPLSPLSIANRVRNRFGFTEATMNVRVIKSYSHYFWDTTALSTPEWKTLIAHWLPDLDNTDYLAALNSPRSMAGAALTLALVDRNADALTPVARYEAVRDHAFSMYMEHALLQSRSNVQRTQGAYMAFQMLRMADEELTKHRGGSADLLEEFKKLETELDNSKIKSVKDLPSLILPPIIEAEIENEHVPDEEDKELV